MSHPLRRNLLSLTVAQLTARLSATLLVILVARVLGPRPLGTLAFSQAITTYFTVLSDFGLTTLGVREIAKQQSATRYWATTILQVQLIVTAILLLVLGGLLWILPLDPELKLITLLFGLGMIPAALDMTYVFQARQRMEFVALNRALGQLTFLLTGVVLLLLLRHAIAVPIANLVGGFVAAAAAFFLLRRLGVRLSRAPLQDLAKISTAATPFVVGGLVAGLYHNVVPALLTAFTDFRGIGLFSAGYRIVTALLSAADVISNAMLPAIAFSFANDKSAFLRHSVVLARALGGIACGIAVVGSLMATQIFGFLFGPQYSSGLVPFRILMLLPLLGMLSTALTVPLLVANQQVQCMLSVVVGVLGTVAFTLLLAPRMGIIGAAIATLAGEVGIVIYLLVVFGAKLRFARKIVTAYIYKPALASAAVLGSYIGWSYLLRFPPSIAEGIVLGGVYCVSAVAIRLVPGELFHSQTTGGMDN